MSLSLVVAVLPAAVSAPARADSGTAPVESVEVAHPRSAAEALAESNAAVGVTRPRGSEAAEAPAADGELVSLRTAFSNTFLQPDGVTRRVEVAPQPVNYRDVGGAWRHIDTTLSATSDGGFTTTGAPAAVTVPDSAAGPLRVTNPAGQWVQTTLGGAGPADVAAGSGDPDASAAVDASSASAQDALPGVDVAWTATTVGQKESLTLGSAAAPSSFAYHLSLSSGLTPVLVSGRVVVQNAAGVAVFSLPAPFMDDAAGAHSDDVTYALSGNAGTGWSLRLTPSAAWLGSSARVWPVVIDPTISAGGGDLACEITTAAASTSFCGASSVKVGHANGSVSRTLLAFPGLAGAVPADAVMVEANVLMPVTAVTGTGSLPLVARPVSLTWSSAATWNTWNGSTAWHSPGGDSFAPPQPGATVGASPVGSTVSLPVTQVAAKWLRGDDAAIKVGRGLLIQTPDESSAGLTATFSGLGAASSCASSCPMTRLAVTYSTRLGQYSGAQFYDVQLTDRQALHVNLGNGNAVLAASELGNITRTWNSNNTNKTGPLGRSWTMDAGRDVRTVVSASDGSVRYYAPGGAIYVFTQNADGSYAAPAGLSDVVVTRAGNAVTLKFGRSAQTMVFRSDGMLTSVTDRNGNARSYVYSASVNDGDGLPQLATATDAAGRVTTPAYTGTVSMSGLAGPAGRSTSYAYVSGNLTDAGDAAGKHTFYEYDASSRITKITTPGGRVTKLGYDAANRVTSIQRISNPSDQTGPTTSFAWTPITGTPTAASRATTVVTDPLGHATTYQVDSSDRVGTVTDALGHHRDATFGPDNNQLTSADAMGVGTTGVGNTTTFGYTADGSDPQSATLPTGASSTATYDPIATAAHPHQPTSATDAQGNSTGFAYDTPGNVKTVKDTTGAAAGGGVVMHSYTYNPPAGSPATCGGKPGQVCTDTNGLGGVTTYAYDTAGNLTMVTPPAGTSLGASTFTYDPLGRVVTATNGNGKTTRTSYDADDRVTQLRMNNVTTCTSADTTAGNCITTTYDDDGNQLTSVNATGTITYGYDQLARQISKTIPGAATALTLTYDAVGNTATYADAGGTVTYTYFDDNTLTSVANPGGTCGTTPVSCVTYTYNNNGYRTGATLPGGVTETFTPDVSGRPAELKATNGAGTLFDLTYSYAYQGGDTALVQTMGSATNLGGAAGTTTTYSYDTLSRLTDAAEKNTANAQTARWTYAYDRDGNRTSGSTTFGSSTTAHTWTYNAADQLTTQDGAAGTWGYDADGNETSNNSTRTSSYTAADALASVTVSGTASTFAYASPGNYERTGTTTGPNTTSYLHGELGLTTQTVNGTQTRFTRDPAGGLVAMRTAGTEYFYLLDPLGSVIALTTTTGARAAGYSYQPYGAVRAITADTTGSTTTATANPWRWAGSYQDTATGLYKLGHRYYDPGTGRFTQPDPSGQEANSYLYAGGNPLNFADPTGLSFLGDLVRTVVSGVIGAATAAAVAVSVGAITTPFIGGIVGGCVGGATFEALDSSLSAGAGSVIGGCIVGALGGTRFDGLVNDVINVIRNTRL